MDWRITAGQCTNPVKIDRNVSLIQTSEPVLADELLRDRRSWHCRPAVAGVLLVARQSGEAIEELKKMGHATVVNPL